MPTRKKYNSFYKPSFTISAGEEKSFVDGGIRSKLSGPDGHLVEAGARDRKVPEFFVIVVPVAADHLQSFKNPLFILIWVACKSSKNGIIPAPFVYFLSFFVANSMQQIEKSLDDVHGIRPQDGRRSVQYL